MTVIMLLALLAGACAEEDLDYRPPVGVSGLSENVEALSLTVVTDGTGVATLVGTLFNQGPHADVLVDVAASPPPGDGGEPVVARLTRGPVPLPVGEPVRLAPLHAVTLTSEEFLPAYGLELTLTFARSGPIRLVVLVFPRDGFFADVPVVAAAQPR